MSINLIRIRHFHFLTMEYVLPNKIRGHFQLRKSSLAGTIATQENQDGTLSVGIARPHPNEQPTSRPIGAQIAIQHLKNFQADLFTGIHDSYHSAKIMSRDELINMIYSQTFFGMELNPYRHIINVAKSEAKND